MLLTDRQPDGRRWKLNLLGGGSQHVSRARAGVAAYDVVSCWFGRRRAVGEAFEQIDRVRVSTRVDEDSTAAAAAPSTRPHAANQAPRACVPKTASCPVKSAGSSSTSYGRSAVGGRAVVTNTIRLRFDGRSTAYRRDTGRWPASRSHAELFIYLRFSAAARIQVGLRSQWRRLLVVARTNCSRRGVERRSNRCGIFVVTTALKQRQFDLPCT